MLILPKVPHSLRTLTSSLGRVLDASISSVAGGAQPSVTFTSSGANVYPVIGGGGPFTSNHALLGGGALTHTGHGVGTGMAHLNWTPTSGGGAGAGRSSGGGGQTFHGYTGHARALLQTNPAAATDSASLLDDDDAELQAALANHRYQLRAPNAPLQLPSGLPNPRPEGGESVQVVRRSEMLRLPEVQRRLRAAFEKRSEDVESAKRVQREKFREVRKEIESLRKGKGRERMVVGAEKEVKMLEASGEVVEEARPAVGRKVSFVEPSRRPRGRSITTSPLIFLDYRSSLLSSSSPLPTSSVSARAFSQTTTYIDQEDLETVDYHPFASLESLTPVSNSYSPPEPVRPGSPTPSLDGLALHDLPPRPPHRSSSVPPLDSSELFSHETPPHSTLSTTSPLFPESTHSDIDALSLESHAERETQILQIQPLDHQRQAVLVSAVDEAVLTRDPAPVLAAVQEYLSLEAPSLPASAAKGSIPLPAQTAETMNVALRGLAIVRPPGASIEQITETYTDMLRLDVPPTLETYAIVLRVLCERELEVQEAIAFDDHLHKKMIQPPPPSPTALRTPPNLLPPPAIFQFNPKPDMTSVRAERKLDEALSLFAAVTYHHVFAPQTFEIEVYEGLLSACATAGKMVEAARVYAHLEKKAESREGKEKGLMLTYAAFEALVEGYGKTGEMENVMAAYEEMQRVEREDSLAGEGTDEERIHVRNALIGAHFANKDPASALAIVESLIPSNPNPSSSLSLSEPFVQSSTFTSVIKGFLSLDDVPSALSWFHRIVASDSPLPPLEPEAFVALLSVASQKRDVALYDEVFDRFTANPPIGYHFRPVELAEAIHLHIEAAEAPSVSSEARNRHIDRIFEFVRRCDEHERSRYLYPAVIAGPLLRLLILESRLDDVADVYGRALRAAQENVEDPLSVISFHSHFVESTIHWVTSESATPLRLNIQDRLHLVSTIYGNAQIASLPTDLTIRDLAPRVFHLYQQAKLEVAGDTSALDLRNETVSLLLEAAVMVDLRNQPASTAVACATILDDLIGIQRRSGQTFDVDLMTAAQTVVACRGEEYASNLLAPLGPAFLQACGLYVLASQAESFPAPPASIADSTVSLNPDAPAFEPSPASSGPSIALTSSELANSATSVTSGPPSLIDDDSTALAKPKPNALAFYSELHESLQIDKSLSDIVDLAFTFSPKQTQAKMTALDSYNLLKDGLTNGYVARVEVLARLISGLGRMSEKDKMIEVFELAHAVNFYTEGQEKRWFDIESAVIIGFANCGDMERANFHRQNILQAGGAPTADAYGALVTGTKDSTDVAAIARQLYTEARSHGVKMNLFFYNTLISIFARARKAEEALTLFYAAMDEGITLRTVTYAAAVNACCRVGKTEEAISLFEEMRRQANYKPKIPPFNIIMQYFTTTFPDRARVLHYYDEMRKDNVSPSSHTYNILMQAYGTVEPLDLEAMHKVFDTMRQHAAEDRRIGTKAKDAVKVEGVHWATLINCHGAVNRDLESALQIFDSIPSYYPQPSAYPDAVCWEAIYGVIGLHKRFDLLDQYIAKHQASGTPSSSYIQNVLIRTYAAEGHLDKARELFETMLDPPMGVSAPPAGSAKDNVIFREPSSYEAMLRAELGAHERERALDLANRMEARMYPLSVTSRIRSILGEYEAEQPSSKPTSP